MKHASVIPLLENWENFNRENPQKDIYDFARWLLSVRQDPQKESMKPVEHGDNAARIAVLITRIQKYLAFYVKPTVQQLGFHPGT
ncbi:MAG: hypothetical protein WDM78_05390 [Puia sp.]